MAKRTALQNTAVIYGLYPASFKSTRKSGYGTLRGITQKLDYLSWLLGRDSAIWLNPIYVSPRKDGWYDVADPYKIDPLFGTDHDLDILLAKAKERGLRFIFDLVVNHVSDQHRWFKLAAQTPWGKYGKYFIFHLPTEDNQPPSNHVSATGAAWTRLPNRWWYYHTFAPEQPDLNTDNPVVVEEILNWVRFWYRRGVMGFRVDAIPYAGKKPENMVKDETANPDWDGQDQLRSTRHEYTKFQPGMFEFLRKLSAINTEPEFAGQGHIMILEGYPDEAHQYRQMYEVMDLGSSAPLQLDLVRSKWSAPEIRQAIGTFLPTLVAGAWPVWNMDNHDNPRLIDRIGEGQLFVAMMLLMLLPGTPQLYYGDEIGMSNGPEPKKRMDEFIAFVRDKTRAGMSWSKAKNAGFTPDGVTPWVRPSLNYRTHNVETMMADPKSLLHFTRRLIELRRTEPFSGLEYEAVSVGSDDHILAFRRRDALVVLNLSDAPQPVELPKGLSRLVLGSSRASYSGETKLTLDPGEGLVLA